MYANLHTIILRKTQKKIKKKADITANPLQNLQKNRKHPTNSTILHTSSYTHLRMWKTPFGQLSHLLFLSSLNIFFILSSEYPKAPANRLNSARCWGLNASYSAFIGFFP